MGSRNVARLDMSRVGAFEILVDSKVDTSRKHLDKMAPGLIALHDHTAHHGISSIFS